MKPKTKARGRAERHRPAPAIGLSNKFIGLFNTAPEAPSSAEMTDSSAAFGNLCHWLRQHCPGKCHHRAKPAPPVPAARRTKAALAAASILCILLASAFSLASAQPVNEAAQLGQATKVINHNSDIITSKK